ncbi:MAG: hypothetical protein HQK79_18615 [Desulfobacterales bacterium]|nr:hypothetical protein [Desulfobacterales bacterium]MBF0397868.1 hypothetical protein [Desulfobacterales bacterium]
MIDNGFFGDKFPDNDGVVGINKSTMSLAISVEFQELEFPLNPIEKPATTLILDFLEFCHEHIAKPIKDIFHDFLKRYRLSFYVKKGQS